MNVLNMTTIFHDRQSGGWDCRVHAINNWYGKRVLDAQEYNRWYERFKNYANPLMQDHNERLNNELTDGSLPFQFANPVTWDGTSFISYLLRWKFGLECFTVRMFAYDRYKNQGVFRSLVDLVDMNVPGFFVCNTQHIWVIRQYSGNWVCVDSLRAIRQISLNELMGDSSLTFIFPWTLTRCRQGVRDMQRVVRTKFRGLCTHTIRRMILEDLTSGRAADNFGDMQIWFALFHRYLAATRTGYEQQVDRFRTYAMVKRNDLMNNLEHLPGIIMFIIDYR